MRTWLVLCLALCLSACQSILPRMNHWAAYTRAYDGLDSTQEREAAREQALNRYQSAPDDPARLRLAYVLSRPSAPLPQLERSRVILAEIPPASAYAPLRDLLDGELEALVELRRIQGHTDELEARLEALKEIETDLQSGRRNKEVRER